MTDESAALYYLSLPDNSKLPRRCRTMTIPLRTTNNHSGRRLFEADLIYAGELEAKQRWLRCVACRQHLLFCSGLAAEACQDVINTIQQGKWKAAALWMNRAARLLAGSAEAVRRSCILDNSFYHTGGGACCVTQLPDVRSSNEHRFLRAILKETERVLDSAQVSKVTAAANEFIDARRAFDEAVRSFIGTGLFQTDNLDTDSDDRVNPLPSPERYDLAVGVLRTKMMFIEDYQFNLVRSVDIARSADDAHDIDGGARARLEECNQLMLAIVGELLDPPSYQPSA